LTQAIYPFVVYFTSDTIDLQDCGCTDGLYNGGLTSAIQVTTLDAYCQSYYATYCANWFGNSDATNCTPSKLWYMQQASCSEKKIHCDNQMLRFELKY